MRHKNIIKSVLTFVKGILRLGRGGSFGMPGEELIEQGKKLARADEVALILNVTKQRVYEIARENVLPPGVIVRIGRQVRFDLEALREWIACGGSTENVNPFPSNKPIA